jgi:hypothetical protein
MDMKRYRRHIQTIADGSAELVDYVNRYSGL